MVLEARDFQGAGYSGWGVHLISFAWFECCINILQYFYPLYCLWAVGDFQGFCFCFCFCFLLYGQCYYEHSSTQNVFGPQGQSCWVIRYAYVQLQQMLLNTFVKCYYTSLHSYQSFVTVPIAHFNSSPNSNLWVFFPTPRNSVTPAVCPTIQLSSDTIYLEIASNPHRGSVLQDCSLPSTSGVSHKFSASDLPAIDWRRFQWPFLGFD